jgi:hypothetical protein
MLALLNARGKQIFANLIAHQIGRDVLGYGIAD